MKLSETKLQLAMAEKCINLTDLCKKADIAEITLRKGRQGTRNLKPETIGKIAKALGVTPSEIVEDYE